MENFSNLIPITNKCMENTKDWECPYCTDKEWHEHKTQGTVTTTNDAGFI